MKRNMAALLLTVPLLLTGCGFPNGSYVSVTPHQEQRQNTQSSATAAKDYLELVSALTEMVAAGTETATILVPDYPADTLENGMAVAVRYVMDNDAIGAYAVDAIDYSQGSSGGQPALAVKITYVHSRPEIRRIRSIESMEEADGIVANALAKYDASVVLLAKRFSPRDFTQFVEDYGEDHPDLVMEIPQVSANVYGTGEERVVELIFTYQTGRDDLRQMQSLVKPVFEAATLYVSGDSSQWQKYSQLYSFLMERFDYTIQTSITPAYSLLHHGVGDSRAFANVYAAMCRASGLQCMVVKGTRQGEPWTWNIVYHDGSYYHVDLLHCNEQGRFTQRTDLQMQGYVWDYSAYPQCVVPQEGAEETSPETEKPEETLEPENNPEIFENEA